VSLPRLLILTDRSMCRTTLPSAVAAAVHCGARAVVLREKDLPSTARSQLYEELVQILAPVGGLVISAGSAPSGRDGVHLAARDDFPAPRPPLVGRSCHNVAEIDQARAEGCDYVTLSPVFLTASKPGYGPALGLAGLAQLTPGAPSVYALGGIQPADVFGCLGAGARGVAVMGPVMRDPAIVSQYLAKLSEVSP
jgi:thiamine-phosphate diphosphorylase